MPMASSYNLFKGNINLITWFLQSMSIRWSKGTQYLLFVIKGKPQLIANCTKYKVGIWQNFKIFISSAVKS